MSLTTHVGSFLVFEGVKSTDRACSIGMILMIFVPEVMKTSFI